MTVSRTPVTDSLPLPHAYVGETERRYVVIEVIEPPGLPGPRPYVHLTHEEAFCVFGGNVTLHIGEKRMHARREYSRSCRVA